MNYIQLVLKCKSIKIIFNAFLIYAKNQNRKILNNKI